MDARIVLLTAGILCFASAARPASDPPGGWHGGEIAGQGGGLRVTPTRLVLEGAQRSAELRIANTGSVRALYRIEFVQMRMRPDGGLEEFPRPEPCPDCADRLVRYSPRQVELEPGQAQTVRLRIEKPGDLAPGEYRSHLVARIVPSADADRAPPSDPSHDVAIDLKPIYGVAIPVIVRQGPTFARASVTEIAFPSPGDSSAALRFVLHREGSRSIYGNVSVTCLGSGGTGTKIGELRGVAIYVPNARRTIEVPVLAASAARICAGTVRVEFREAGAGGVTASAEQTPP